MAEYSKFFLVYLITALFFALIAIISITLSNQLVIHQEISHVGEILASDQAGLSVLSALGNMNLEFNLTADDSSLENLSDVLDIRTDEENSTAEVSVSSIISQLFGIDDKNVWSVSHLSPPEDSIQSINLPVYVVVSFKLLTSHSKIFTESYDILNLMQLTKTKIYTPFHLSANYAATYNTEEKVEGTLEIIRETIEGGVAYSGDTEKMLFIQKYDYFWDDTSNQLFIRLFKLPPPYTLNELKFTFNEDTDYESKVKDIKVYLVPMEEETPIRIWDNRRISSFLKGAGYFSILAGILFFLLGSVAFFKRKSNTKS
jgi:hypothetical protein